MAKLNYDLTNNQILTGAPDVLEAGKYVVKITDVEVVQNKTHNDNAVLLSLNVIEGASKGKSINDRLNTEYPTGDTAQIALSQAKTYLFFGGADNCNSLTDTDQFLGLDPVIITVTKDPNSYTDRNGMQKTGFNNNVNKIEKFNGEVPSDPIVQQAPQSVVGTDIFAEAKAAAAVAQNSDVPQSMMDSAPPWAK